MSGLALGAIALFLAGCVLSWFFNGIETGFYRVTRLRLVMDAYGGSRLARALWWVANRPSLFVATTQVGNNVANYLSSLAIVTLTHIYSPGETYWAEMALTILTTPIIFVFCELLPKSLFYETPYRRLMRSGPLFLAAMILLCVPAAMLWALSKVLELIGGESPQQVKMALARRELQQVLDEGHVAGVLRPAQQLLAQGLLSVAVQPVGRFATPPGRVLRLRLGASKAELLRLARRHQQSEIILEEPLGGRRLVGYVRVVDLCLANDEELPKVRDLMQIPQQEAHIAALMRMQAAKQPLARVVDDRGQTVGIVTREQFTAPLVRGG